MVLNTVYRRDNVLDHPLYQSTSYVCKWLGGHIPDAYPRLSGAEAAWRGSYIVGNDEPRFSPKWT